jgi:hypothetical protein
MFSHVDTDLFADLRVAVVFGHCLFNALYFQGFFVRLSAALIKRDLPKTLQTKVFVAICIEGNARVGPRALQGKSYPLWAGNHFNLNKSIFWKACNFHA